MMGLRNQLLGAALSTSMAFGAPGLAEAAPTNYYPGTETATDCPTSVKNLGEVTPTCMKAAQALLRADGFVDPTIAYAVGAFQIEAGITSQNQSGFGNIGPATYSSIMSGAGIAKMNSAKDKRNNAVVIDKSDQTIVAYRYGKVLLADLTSTGKSTSYQDRETADGSFVVQRSRTSESGWVHSDLEANGAEPQLYRPRYVNGKVAVHGTRVVSHLGRKDSHGCARTNPSFQDALIAAGVLDIGDTVIIQE
ncbi:MAG: Peptidoglycan-binding domain 1 protein [Candidatus Saccharibacteria bacterium]|nr:Peptidoglycan-binding domain 1 protein [Candidatus Saccharibacteria bacterium]